MEFTLVIRGIHPETHPDRSSVSYQLGCTVRKLKLTESDVRITELCYPVRAGLFQANSIPPWRKSSQPSNINPDCNDAVATFHCSDEVLQEIASNLEAESYFVDVMPYQVFSKVLVEIQPDMIVERNREALKEFENLIEVQLSSRLKIIDNVQCFEGKLWQVDIARDMLQRLNFQNKQNPQKQTSPPFNENRQPSPREAMSVPANYTAVDTNSGLSAQGMASTTDSQQQSEELLSPNIPSLSQLHISQDTHSNGRVAMSKVESSDDPSLSLTATEEKTLKHSRRVTAANSGFTLPSQGSDLPGIHLCTAEKQQLSSTTDTVQLPGKSSVNKDKDFESLEKDASPELPHSSATQHDDKHDTNSTNEKQELESVHWKADNVPSIDAEKKASGSPKSAALGQDNADPENDYSDLPIFHGGSSNNQSKVPGFGVPLIKPNHWSVNDDTSVVPPKRDTVAPEEEKTEDVSHERDSGSDGQSGSVTTDEDEENERDTNIEERERYVSNRNSDLRSATNSEPSTAPSRNSLRSQHSSEFSQHTSSDQQTSQNHIDRTSRTNTADVRPKHHNGNSSNSRDSVDDSLTTEDPKDSAMTSTRAKVRKLKSMPSSEGDIPTNAGFLLHERVEVVIHRSNITQLAVDAIVNAANEDLRHSGGVALAIADAAGQELTDDSREIVKHTGTVSVTEVVRTSAGNLPCNMVLHAVGPKGYTPKSKQILQDLLEKTFENVFNEAEKNNVFSIAVPAISSGIYGVPVLDVASALLAVLTAKSSSFRTLQHIHLVDLNPEVTTTLITMFISRAQHENPGVIYQRDNASVKRIIDSSFALPRTYSFYGVIFSLHQTNITHMLDVDAIVCCTDEKLEHKTGVSRAIAQAAGAEFTQKCQPLKKLSVGQAEFVNLTNFPNVIVTVGPKEFSWNFSVFSKTNDKQPQEIKKTLTSVFKLAKQLEMRSIALPPISTGAHGCPKDVFCEKLFDVLVDQTQQGSSLQEIHLVDISPNTLFHAVKLFEILRRNIPGVQLFRDTYQPSTGQVSQHGGDPYSQSTGQYGSDSYSQGTRRHGGDSYSQGTGQHGGDSDPRGTGRNGGDSDPRGTGRNGGNPDPWGTGRRLGDAYSKGTGQYGGSINEELMDTSEQESASGFTPHSASDNNGQSGFTKSSNFDSSDETTSQIFSSNYRNRGNNQTGNSSSSSDTPPTVKDPQADTTTQTDSSSKQDSKSQKQEPDECVICMSVVTSPKILPNCKHIFCQACIDECFQKMGPKCPSCGQLYGKLRGNQPIGGRMSIRGSHLSLPGYERAGSIQIDYFIPGGTQGPNHPNPGHPFSGTSRSGYLPDTKDGQEVLSLLQRAFDQQLVFTVGKSSTTGAENQVTWNDIHHKTNTHGGQDNYGYPDPTYLNRVRQELAAKGIK